MLFFTQLDNYNEYCSYSVDDNKHNNILYNGKEIDLALFSYRFTSKELQKKQKANELIYMYCSSPRAPLSQSFFMTT